jgi:RHS repeat-associated protein
MRIRHRLSERGDIDYFYDDKAVLEERNAGDDSLVAHYRYADRLLSLSSGSDTQYYHHDALGSTTHLSKADGTTQVSYRLDPWGHVTEQQGTSVNRQVFTGQEHDENTGLIYFGARYYDPDAARFLNQDSYLGEANNPPSLHRFLYAYANPLIYTDPDGHAVVAAGENLQHYTTSSDNVTALMPLTNALAEAQGIEPLKASRTGEGAAGREVGYKPLADLKQGLNAFGINKDSAMSSAVMTVEKGDEERDVRDAAFAALGKGFQQEYAHSDGIRAAFDDRFRGVSAGDMINMSDFYQHAMVKTSERAAKHPGGMYYRDVVENNGTVPIVSKVLGGISYNTLVAQDKLAPPQMREEGAWSTFNAVVAAAGPVKNVRFSTVPKTGIPKGITYEGRVHRAVNPKYVDSAWDIHSGNIAASHRYSDVGRGALYSGTSKNAVLGELKHYGVDPADVAWVSKKVKVGNVLDLTNPSVRRQLGVSLDQLTSDSYFMTHALGDFSRTRYSGMLVPSARAEGASHLVTFPK